MISRINSFVLSISLFSGFSLSAQAEDDYLKKLEQEASTVEELHTAQKEQRELKLLSEANTADPVVTGVAATPLNPVPRPIESPLEVNQTEFERDLFKQFPGSYILYSMLQEGQKVQVLGEYQTNEAEGVSRFVPVINKIIQFSISN